METSEEWQLQFCKCKYILLVLTVKNKELFVFLFTWKPSGQSRRKKESEHSTWCIEILLQYVFCSTAVSTAAVSTCEEQFGYQSIIISLFSPPLSNYRNWHPTKKIKTLIMYLYCECTKDRYECKYLDICTIPDLVRAWKRPE